MIFFLNPSRLSSCHPSKWPVPAHDAIRPTLTSIPEKENNMHTLALILADGVTIQLGGNIWTFSSNFLIYLIVAAVVGLVAEALVGWRLPFGFIGAIIAAL